MILFRKWEGKQEYRTNKRFIKARKFKDLVLVETDDYLEQRYLKIVLKFKMYEGTRPAASPAPVIEQRKKVIKKSTPIKKSVPKAEPVAAKPESKSIAKESKSIAKEIIETTSSLPKKSTTRKTSSKRKSSSTRKKK